MMDFCDGCPNATGDDTGEFDVICVARSNAEPFLVPDECPVCFGEWGAWRSFADNHLALVFLVYWCARTNGWSWDALQLGRLLHDAVPQLAEPVGWSP